MKVLIRKGCAIAASVAVLTLGACAPDQVVSPSQDSSRLDVDQPNLTETSTDFYYGYRTPAFGWGTYDEIYAVSQGDEPDDGLPSCPRETVTKDWKFSLAHDQLPRPEPDDYIAHFVVQGPKVYVRSLGLSPKGYPVAAYRHLSSAQSHDGRWIMEAQGIFTLLCSGRYIRLPGGRLWVGNYWPVAHEGTLTPGPNYCDPTESDWDLDPYSYEYDPYTSSSSSGACVGGSGGSGSGDPGDGSTQPGDGELGVGVSPGEGSGGHEVCGGSTDLYYDYMCIEEWNGEEWVSIWCGVVAVCNSYGS